MQSSMRRGPQLCWGGNPLSESSLETNHYPGGQTLTQQGWLLPGPLQPIHPPISHLGPHGWAPGVHTTVLWGPRKAQGSRIPRGTRPRGPGETPPSPAGTAGSLGPAPSWAWGRAWAQDADEFLLTGRLA